MGRGGQDQSWASPSQGWFLSSLGLGGGSTVDVGRGFLLTTLSG